MPKYKYLCPTCGKTFYEIRTIENRDKGNICPACYADAKRVPAEHNFLYSTKGLLHK